MTDPDVSLLLRASVAAIEADPSEAKARFHAVAVAAAPHKKVPCTNCGVRHRDRTAEQCIDREMSEQTLQDRIRDRAKRRGWTVAHAGKGIAAFTATGEPVFVTAMPKGWLDLMLFKASATPPVWAAELKTEEGVVSEEQWFWLDLLNRCGIPAVVFRPSDLREGRVNAILDGK